MAGVTVGRVVVVGSVNSDLVLRCRHLPAPGETVVADDVRSAPGGKGANQAVAAARLGAPTLLVGAVGDDAEGRAAISALSADDVDVTPLVTVSGARTGHATVVVSEDGENLIVVAPGANGVLTEAMVSAALRAAGLRPGDVVLSSGEVPAACAAAAAGGAAAAGAVALHNLAPFRGLDPWLMRWRPVLVLNSVEARQATDEDDVRRAAAALLRHAAAVVVTRGALGALVADSSGVHEVPGVRASRVVDTTGAGDAFCGALAAELSTGAPLRDAVRTAVRAGAVAVTGAGARGALATRRDLAGVDDPF